MYFPLIVGVLCLSLFWYAFLFVFSSFAIILKRKRELVALLLLSYGYLVTVYVLWLFLTLPWVGLLCVIVVFPDHTNFLFYFSRRLLKTHTNMRIGLIHKLSIDSKYLITL